MSLIEEYITETGSHLTASEMEREMHYVYLNNDEGDKIGFIGFERVKREKGNAVIIKAAYIQKPYRGKMFFKLVRIILREFKKMGFVWVEVWAKPEIAKWVERKYHLQPEFKSYVARLDSLNLGE